MVTALTAAYRLQRGKLRFVSRCGPRGHADPERHCSRADVKCRSSCPRPEWHDDHGSPRGYHSQPGREPIVSQP